MRACKTLPIFIISTIFVIIMASCGGDKIQDPRVVLERVPEEPFDWWKTGKVPVDKSGQVMHWLGRATRKTTEEKAILDAYSDASNYVLMYIATKGLFDYEKVNIEQGYALSEEAVGHLRNEATKLLAENLIQKLAITEEQYIRYVYQDRPTLEYYDAQVHVAIPNDQLNSLMSAVLHEQFKQAQEKNNQAALEYLQRARQLFEGP